jgi:hypothetical protein
MRRSRTPAVMCFIACLTIAAPGRAGTDSGGDAYRWGPIAIARSGADAFIAGVGAFDLQDRRSSLSAGANAEYRFGRKLFVIGPALGLVANLDGGVYGYFGLYADISIGPIVLARRSPPAGTGRATALISGASSSSGSRSICLTGSTAAVDSACALPTSRMPGSTKTIPEPRRRTSLTRSRLAPCSEAVARLRSPRKRLRLKRRARRRADSQGGARTW